ncbi:hypothetical protein Tco_0208294, partial [Tanacetum coccineum]
EQYIQMIDYAQWEAIENDATLPKTTTVEGVVIEKIRAVEKRFGGNRNTSDSDTMSMDDIYNNLKVYEPQVKGMSSSSSSTQNMAFASSSNNYTSSTNEAVNTANGISTAST